VRLDPEKLRSLLLAIEKITDGIANHETDSFVRLNFPNEDTQLLLYHMKYLIDNGFVQEKNGFFRDITPSGREFLDNVRDNEVWTKTKKKLSTFGSVAVPVMSEIAASIIKKLAGLS
jgi:hypothetical protein